MKKEDDGAVPLSLPPPPIAAAAVTHLRHQPHMMRVLSRSSFKKVPPKDTTDFAVSLAVGDDGRRGWGVGWGESGWRGSWWCRGWVLAVQQVEEGGTRIRMDVSPLGRAPPQALVNRWREGRGGGIERGEVEGQSSLTTAVMTMGAPQHHSEDFSTILPWSTALLKYSDTHWRSTTGLCGEVRMIVLDATDLLFFVTLILLANSRLSFSGTTASLSIKSTSEASPASSSALEL